MSSIFISHSSRDNAAAREMQVWLEARGHAGVFLDFDPALGIPVGVDWEQELYQRLRACRAVVALVSPAWLASPWCFFELRQARFLGKAVFPVRIEPCDSGPILADIQEGDLVGDREAGLMQLWAGMRRAGLDPATMLHYDPARPPYPGLQALQEADAAVFFGRDDEISGALDALASLRRVGGARLLLLLGASGSGKSSLLRAGLLPRLRRDASAWLVIEPMRPGERPLGELAAALDATADRLDLASQRDALRKLVDGGDPAAFLGLLDELRAAAGCRDGAALIVIDQAEEMLGGDGEPAAFLKLLRGALEHGAGRVMAVATLRSDRLGSLQSQPLLEDLAYATRTIDPLPRRSLPQVIEGPAEVAGLAIGPGLVSTLIEDAATSDALPLLAFTLHELHRRSRDGVLDLALYRELGGLEGSVRRAADGLIQTLDPGPAALATLRDVFVGRLVRSDEEGVIVRRRALRDELPAEALPLLQSFVDSRLLVAGRDAAGRETLEIAHEALLRTWPRLRDWLDEDHERLRLRDAFRRAAAVWEEQGRGADWLDHRGARLEAIEALAETPRFALASGTERDYLAACRKRERQEQDRAAAEAEAERRRLEAEAAAASISEAAARRVAARTRIAAVVSLILALAASGAGFVAYRNAIEANEQRQAAEVELQARELADSRRLALNATQAVRNGNAKLGVRIALAALPKARARGAGPPDTEQAAEALALAVLQHHEMQPLVGHEGAIRTATFAPDGNAVLTGSADGTARLWDPSAPAEPLILRGFRDGVSAAIFTGVDGIATASAAGTVRLWDRTGSERRVLSDHRGEVLALAVSPDGKRLLSASTDGTARLWPLPEGAPVVLAHPGPVWAAIFGGDGTVALTVTQAEASWTAVLWDGFTGAQVATLETDPTELVDATADGSTLLTVGEDGTGRLWDVTGRLLGQLDVAESWVNAARFSPDDSRLVLAAHDLLHVFETAGRRLERTIDSRQDSIEAVSFSPDGRWLASAAHDGSARVFDVESGTLLAALNHAVGQPLRAIAFAPDGQSLVTAGDDGVARLYRLRSFAGFDELLAFASKLELEPLTTEERSALFIAER